MVSEHLSGYQSRDEEVVDYQMCELPGTGLSFRGPQPVSLDAGTYFSCIGAAQTFGCFCERPFPVLLAQRYGLPALNLGYGGAGPFFFLRHPPLLRYLNRSRFVVVQVMSGRSEDNSLFQSGGLEYLVRRRDGRRFSAAAAWHSVLEGNYYWNKLPVGKQLARRICRARGRRQAQRLVSENRRNWCRSYRQLLAAIECPKVLFWFSKRSPDLVDDFSDVNTLFNEFPHLVTRAMVESLRDACDLYVECVTQRGSPQPLISRHTGLPCTVDLSKDRDDFAGIVWTHNPYYPSPQMHEDAADALAKALDARSEWRR
jgi:hypothetical protein